MSRRQRSKIDGRAPEVRRLNGHRSGEREPLYVVGRSRIHGRGVFAARTISKGTRIIEYTGRRISNAAADERYPEREGAPTHTFLFELDDDRVIDAGRGGNAARWINHSCDPNCEAVEEDGRIFIEAVRTIAAGEELGYDYGIILDERHTLRERRRWPCFCGADGCRGTLLKTKRQQAKIAPG